MHPEDKEACIKLTAIYVLLFVAMGLLLQSMN
jgi:hypothetical protein